MRCFSRINKYSYQHSSAKVMGGVWRSPPLFSVPPERKASVLAAASIWYQYAEANEKVWVSGFGEAGMLTRLPCMAVLQPTE